MKADATAKASRRNPEVNARSLLRQQQVDWATTTQRQPDPRGYLDSYASNLFQPLSAEADSAFTRGSGSELLPRDGRPAKMAALHSSSALAVNVFDYWSGKPPSALASALGIRQAPSHFQFERQFPTGLGGTPPNLDLAFFYPDHMLGLESKFSEWLTPKLPGKAPFKSTYFPTDTSLWSRAGLPNAQRLAQAMQANDLAFRHLDAAQLMKHMLGLAIAAPGRCSLYYLYFDCPGPEASIHRAEIAAFADGIGADMPFYWASYQHVFGRLRATLEDVHRPYLDYLAHRYFKDAA